MANNLGAGLLARWKFDTTGDKADDGPSGAFPFVHEAGAVIMVAGFRGLACAFGTDIANRLSVADVAEKRFNFGDNSFSVGALVRSVRATNNPYLGKWDSSGSPDTDDCWLLWNRSLTAAHRFSISSDGTSEETIVEVNNPDDVGGASPWQLVVAGYDKDAGHIFISVDGGAKVTTPHAGGAFGAAAVNLTAGWFEGATKTMGSHDQDESAIWERALTAEDITAWWDGGSILPFDEWQGGRALASGYYQYY